MEQNYEVTDCSQLYFNDLKKYKPLTKEEEKKLLKKYKLYNDLSARNELITSNLKYACKLAYSYRGRGVSFPDLISEANRGLIESIDKFDMKQNVKVFSYAKWWIMQKMQIAINKSKKMPESEIPNEDFIDSPINDEEEIRCTLEENKKTSYENNFIQQTFNEEDNSDKEFLSDLFKVLSEREEDMINMYYGRNYDKEYTLEEIGNKYSLTKERVRQIIEKCFTKIRSEAMMIENSYV